MNRKKRVYLSLAFVLDKQGTVSTSGTVVIDPLHKLVNGVEPRSLAWKEFGQTGDGPALRLPETGRGLEIIVDVKDDRRPPVRTDRQTDRAFA